MKPITYERARTKIAAENDDPVVADRLYIIALHAFLLALPVLVMLSAVDPSGFIIHRVLDPPSPLLWNGWALLCFWASLSPESLLKKLGRKSPLYGHSQSAFFLAGMMNCISVVALLWLVGRAA